MIFKQNLIKLITNFAPKEIIVNFFNFAHPSLLTKKTLRMLLVFFAINQLSYLQIMNLAGCACWTFLANNLTWIILHHLIKPISLISSNNSLLLLTQI